MLSRFQGMTEWWCETALRTGSCTSWRSIFRFTGLWIFFGV